MSGRCQNLASSKQFISTFAYGLAISVLSAVMPAERAYADSEITNSEISQIAVWIRPGEKLEISNSKLCLTGEQKCVLFIDQDAHLEISNTQLGKSLDIYHVDSQVESIELANSPSAAKFIEGHPAEFSAEQAAVTSKASLKSESSGRSREITNQLLEDFSVSIKAGETLSFSNSKVCLSSGEDECVISIQPGGKLEANNTKFGRRVVIASPTPLVDGVQFSNVQFAGSTRLLDAARTTVAVTPKIAEENKQVAAALRAQKLHAEVSERGVVVSLPDVFFEFDKSNLTPEAKVNVTKMASILEGVRGRGFSVEGHTDSMGTDSYNNKLSQSRANTVREALREHGIAGASMQAVGFGESRPVDTNETELGRAKNRRVEVIIENSPIASTGSRPTGAGSITAGLNRDSQGNSIVVNDEKTEVVNDKGHIRVDDSGVSVHTKDMKIDVDANGVRIR